MAPMYVQYIAIVLLEHRIRTFFLAQKYEYVYEDLRITCLLGCNTIFNTYC